MELQCLGYSPSTWWRDSELCRGGGSLVIPTCLPSHPLYKLGGHLFRQESLDSFCNFYENAEICSASGPLIGDIECFNLGSS